ncbi:MAG TPA: hypothetical protein PK771_12340, partial [Spirochaetota bacterium]|nr:hypothetical protein [Spirochaetota bacterium]
NKVKELFHNNKFDQKYNDIKSLFIYPLKIFGQIKALLLIGFKDNVNEKLSDIVNTLEKNNDVLRKQVIKII